MPFPLFSFPGPILLYFLLPERTSIFPALHQDDHHLHHGILLAHFHQHHPLTVQCILLHQQQPLQDCSRKCEGRQASFLQCQRRKTQKSHLRTFCPGCSKVAPSGAGGVYRVSQPTSSQAFLCDQRSFSEATSDLRTPSSRQTGVTSLQYIL